MDSLFEIVDRLRYSDKNVCLFGGCVNGGEYTLRIVRERFAKVS
jgi:hypothetical protein